MTELEKNLINISIQDLNKWIEQERNPTKKEIIRRLKEYKMIKTNLKFEERVLVVKNNKFDFEGFTEKCKTIDDIIKTNSEPLTRGYAEYDKRYRQLVGNAVLVKYKNGTRFYGLLERKKGYTENSLIGNLGMVGGHLNIDDPTLTSGLIRECFEELKYLEFNMIKSVEHVGYIRETSTDISNYHICILYLIELQSTDTTSVDSLKSSSNSEKLIWLSEKNLINMINKNNMSNLDSWAIKALKYILSIYDNTLLKNNA